MKVYVTIGGSVACFAISYIAFTSHQTALGWLFLLVGIAIVVFGIASGNKSE
jgi:hypothetical protein